MRYRIAIALGLILLMLGALSGMAAATERSQVCGPLDSGKIDTTGDPVSVVVTAPEGKLIDGYCVKAGSVNQGLGPVYVEVDPPQAQVTITYPDGKAVSHWSVSYVDVPETTTTTQPEVTTTTQPEVTTTTQPEVTTTTQPEVTTTTEPEVTTTTEPETTTTTEAPKCEDDPDTEENECELPYTGAGDVLRTLALIGAGLAAAGYGLVGSATERTNP